MLVLCQWKCFSWVWVTLVWFHYSKLSLSLCVGCVHISDEVVSYVFVSDIVCQHVIVILVLVRSIVPHSMWCWHSTSGAWFWLQFVLFFHSFLFSHRLQSCWQPSSFFGLTVLNFDCFMIVQEQLPAKGLLLRSWCRWGHEEWCFDASSTAVLLDTLPPLSVRAPFSRLTCWLHSTWHTWCRSGSIVSVLIVKYWRMLWAAVFYQFWTVWIYRGRLTW